MTEKASLPRYKDYENIESSSGGNLTTVLATRSIRNAMHSHDGDTRSLNGLVHQPEGTTFWASRYGIRLRVFVTLDEEN